MKSEKDDYYKIFYRHKGVDLAGSTITFTFPQNPRTLKKIVLWWNIVLSCSFFTIVFVLLPAIVLLNLVFIAVSLPAAFIVVMNGWLRKSHPEIATAMHKLMFPMYYNREENDDKKL